MYISLRISFIEAIIAIMSVFTIEDTTYEEAENDHQDNRSSPSIERFHAVKNLSFSSNGNDVSEHSITNFQAGSFDSQRSREEAEQREDAGNQVQEETVVQEEKSESEEERTETEGERIAREERESEQLAWEMMNQESQELYDLQMQFMRENTEGMNEEDRLALQMAIDEAGGPAQQDQDGDNDEEDGEGAEDDVDNWDYDRLLELGHAIGGRTANKPKMVALLHSLLAVVNSKP